MAEPPTEIVCRLRLEASPDVVFALLATDQGRASFWAERTVQRGNEVIFYFPDGQRLTSRILESSPPTSFSLTYFNGSSVTFELREVDQGTDLYFRESNVLAANLRENQAGWVSVLMNLKAQADHRVDLRNHDPRCTWAEGYVDN